MKRQISFTVLCIFVIFTISLSSIQAQEKESVDGFFDNFYVGSLTITSFPMDSTFPAYNPSTTLRIGGLKKINTKIGEFLLAGTYDSNLGTISTVRWQLPITSWLDIQAGLMPRPICFLNRPLPVSGASHFEPPSIGVIPGSGLGSNLIFKINKVNTGYAGIYRGHAGQAEYQLGYETEVQGWEIFASVNSDIDSIFGGALHIKSQWIDFTIFKGHEYTSALAVATLKGGIQPYASMYFQERECAPRVPTKTGYEVCPDEHLEVGITKTFTKNWERLPFSANALIGAGYVILPEKVFNVYFQFYIEI
ncbi:MAG: hypothetical protein K9M44_03375 [Candidatus Pacebacteria bacterium]|nr:hypothetical protein [Candidatus Paceibacterota bacterium]